MVKALRAGALAAFAFCVSSLAMAAPREVTLSVPTMDCATCPITIKAALLKVPGVTRAQVSYAHRRARVSFDDARTDVSALTKATGEAGYPSFAADAP
jgi:periplasmic mercuric ion binding protein